MPFLGSVCTGTCTNHRKGTAVVVNSRRRYSESPKLYWHRSAAAWRRPARNSPPCCSRPAPRRDGTRTGRPSRRSAAQATSQTRAPSSAHPPLSEKVQYSHSNAYPSQASKRCACISWHVSLPLASPLPSLLMCSQWTAEPDADCGHAEGHTSRAALRHSV
jgi:hypothetical protein